MLIDIFAGLMLDLIRQYKYFQIRLKSIEEVRVAGFFYLEFAFACADFRISHLLGSRSKWN